MSKLSSNPPAAPPLNCWYLLCCGCGRMLKADGQLTVQSAFHGGAFNLAQLQEVAKENVLLGCPTHEETDRAAVGLGWSAEDGNHRCPACGPQVRPESHGMYIDSKLLLLIGGGALFYLASNLGGMA